MIDIKIPREIEGCKYIWVSHNGNEYIRFSPIRVQHRDTLDNLAKELGADSLEEEIKCAGHGTFILKEKIFILHTGSFGKSSRYPNCFDVRGFARLMEENTDFEVRRLD